MKTSRGKLILRLLAQEKGRKPGRPLRGLVVFPLPGETHDEAVARTLEQPEYAEHRRAIAAGVHIPTIVLYLLDEPLTLEET